MPTSVRQLAPFPSLLNVQIIQRFLHLNIAVTTQGLNLVFRCISWALSHLDCGVWDGSLGSYAAGVGWHWRPLVGGREMLGAQSVSVSADSSLTACSGVENAGTPQKLLILDARSYTAAVANRAKGGGCECEGTEG